MKLNHAELATSSHKLKLIDWGLARQLVDA